MTDNSVNNSVQDSQQTDANAANADETNISSDETTHSDVDAWDGDKAKEALNKKNRELKGLRDQTKEAKRLAEEREAEAEKARKEEERLRKELEAKEAGLTEVAAEKRRLEVANLRLHVVASMGLPPESISLLHAETKEEIEAEVKKAFEIFGGGTRSSSGFAGGLNPTVDADDSDRAVQDIYKKRRHR